MCLPIIVREQRKRKFIYLSLENLQFTWQGKLYILESTEGCWQDVYLISRNLY